MNYYQLTTGIDDSDGSDNDNDNDHGDQSEG